MVSTALRFYLYPTFANINIQTELRRSLNKFEHGAADLLGGDFLRGGPHVGGGTRNFKEPNWRHMRLTPSSINTNVRREHAVPKSQKLTLQPFGPLPSPDLSPSKATWRLQLLYQGTCTSRDYMCILVLRWYIQQESTVPHTCTSTRYIL